MNIIHQDLILIFEYIILKEIVCNDKVSKNKLAIHEKLKKLIIILISVVRSHSLDFDLEIKFHECINNFIFDR